MAFISVKNLSKIYGSGELEVRALDDISLDVGKGEFVIILGASGAGKTTLLNVLGGMDSATSGNYIIGDKDIAKANTKELESFRRNDIGFVFQFYNLMNNLTAYENVSIAASIVSDPLDPADVLKEVGLDKRADNFPSQLSGGEQQRVSIARAIVKNPKLLLCDEPTGALDSKTGLQILRLLYTLRKRYGTTVVIVTHNSSLAKAATRLVRIADGKIIENTTYPEKESLDQIVW